MEDIRDLRREAFLVAVDYLRRGVPLLGTFGEVDEARIRGWGMMSLPLESVDSAIFAYGERKETCDVINATRIYLETGKCPILFAARGFLTDGHCPAMDALLRGTGKPLFHPEDLDGPLFSECQWQEEVYEEAKEELQKMEALVKKKEGMSEAWALALLYGQYIPDLRERRRFLEEVLPRLPKGEGEWRSLCCGRGILNEKHTGRIVITPGPADIAPKGCIFGAKEERPYEGGDQ